MPQCKLVLIQEKAATFALSFKSPKKKKKMPCSINTCWYSWGSYTAAEPKSWRVNEWKEIFSGKFFKQEFLRSHWHHTLIFFSFIQRFITQEWPFHLWQLHLHPSLTVCVAGGYSKWSLSQSTYFCMQLTHAAVSSCRLVVHVWKGIYSNDLTMLQRHTTTLQVEGSKLRKP